MKKTMNNSIPYNGVGSWKKNVCRTGDPGRADMISLSDLPGAENMGGLE